MPVATCVTMDVPATTAGDKPVNRNSPIVASTPPGPTAVMPIPATKPMQARRKIDKPPAYRRFTARRSKALNRRCQMVTARKRNGGFWRSAQQEVADEFDRLVER